MRKTLLITGFEPFGGESINSAWEGVKLLPEQIGGYALHKLQIPTVFGQGARAALDAAKALKPDLILCIGQAGGRSAVTPERIAVNIRDARIPDNRGNQPRGERVVAEGPAACFATVDVMAMALAAEAQGLPATVSNSAGAFVCNDVFYTLLHTFDGTDTRVGFIHVPWLPEQGMPSLPLEQTVAALKAMIESCEQSGGDFI